MVPVVRKNGQGWTAPVHRLDTLFNQMFEDMDRAVSNAAPRRGGLPVALWEDERAYHVEVEVPGVSESDIEATVQEGQLALRIERKAPEGRTYRLNGRSFGTFERTITLPDAVHNDEVQGELRDGILHLTLPKSPAARPRKIEIQATR